MNRAISRTDSDPPGEGLGAEELGGAHRHPRGHAQGQVALARKLAVVMHRMLVDGTPFAAERAAAAA